MTIKPSDLANMVKNGQFTQLREYGGVEKLARALSCFDVHKGLEPGTADFAEIQRLYGKNELQPPSVPPYLLLVYEGLKDLTICMLLAAAAISLVLGMIFEEDKTTAWIEGTAILVAVFFVVNFQAFTDWSNARTFRKQYFELENAKRINVIRGGVLTTIHPRELVVGDVLRLESGSILPADGVLIEGRALKLDESALTGESKLLEKAPWDHTSDITKEQKSSPFMLSGTSVVNGTGRMLVVAVGANSLQGQILAAVIGQDKKGKKDEEVKEKRGSKASMPPLLENETALGKDLEVRLPSLDTKVFGSGIGGDDEVGRLQSMRLSQFSVRSSQRTAVRDSVRVSQAMPKRRYDRFCCNRDPAPAEINLDSGTLSDKLDTLALRIGKIGALVGLVVFTVMCLRWAIEDFNFGGYCPLFQDNATLCNLAQYNYGCFNTSGDPDCIRAWNGPSDIQRILRFAITAITILVVVVPEGLPLAVTVSLSLSMKRMARENNQVKNMDSSETMGSATTVCTDKTGTLTENRMTVVRVKIGSTEYRNAGEKRLGDVFGGANEVADQVKHKFKEICALATSPSSVVEGKTQKGNATDCALLRLSQEMGYDWKSAREKCTPAQPSLDWGVFVYPFSSSRKRSSIVVSVPEGGFRVYSIGAPQYVLETCTSIVDAGGNVSPFEGAVRQKVDETLEDYAHQAMRTIALAYRDFPTAPPNGWDTPATGHEKAPGNDDVTLLFAAEQGLTVVGIVGIEDPLRASVIQAVQNCYTAGVDVRMCTGDSLETAVAISLQCGILRERDMETGSNGKLYPKECFAMTGAEFDERIHERDREKPLVWRRAFDFKTKKFGEMRAPPFKLNADGEKIVNLKRFDEVWPKLRVLSRCLPEDKLSLVRGLRRSELFRDQNICAELEEKHGIKIFPDFQVVAVTGDGTNDAPALKAANVGFAMGIVGTDIAKQACDIILLDDNFASIVTAIKWGRNVFDSISKFVQFQLTVNFVAIVVACVGAFAFNRSPLGPVQMLWVNLIMDSFAAFALATDPPSPALLDRPPYGKKRPIISMVMYCFIFGQGILQIAIILAILWNPQWIPDENWVTGNVQGFPLPQEDIVSGVINNEIQDNHDGSVHWTVIFNAFVCMQLSNQFNARKLPTPDRLRKEIQEWNVFQDITRNPLFIIILLVEILGQVLIVQFTDKAFVVKALNGPQWFFCIGIGFLSFPWQFVINCVIIMLDSFMNKAKNNRVADPLLPIVKKGLVVKVEDVA